ncbi:hypothetical protein C6P42_002561 [Pichia californica]|nr:hypothetical protein C6P42_002561 [[Candida] californica]
MEDHSFDIYTDEPLLNLNSSNNVRDTRIQLMDTPLQLSNLSNVNTNVAYIDFKEKSNSSNSNQTINLHPSMSDIELEKEFIQFSEHENDDIEVGNNNLTEAIENNNNSNNNINKRNASDDLSSQQENHTRKRIKKPETKWPDALERAFEEAVNLIPKKSLRNLKISGSTYGRNQYISFYIHDKTNIIRTSKQISSHIQAITTSKKYPELSLLLKEGPGDTREICEKFTNVFTEILKKLPDDPEQYINGSFDGKKRDIYFNQISNNSISNNLPDHIKTFRNYIRILFKKFEMSYINFNSIKESHMFSTLDQSLINNDLASVSVSQESLLHEFPIISNIINKSFTYFNHDILDKIPIVYGDVYMTLPTLTNDLTSGCYNFTTKICLSCLPKEEKSYGIITLITCNNFKVQEIFEVLETTTNKSKNDIVFTTKIGNEYWRNYLLNKQKELTYNGVDNIGTSEKTFEMEIKSIKIQQFIFHYNEKILSMNNGMIKLDQVNPLEFRSILAWRFEKVFEQSNAVTIIRRLEYFRNNSNNNNNIYNNNLNNINNNDVMNSSTPIKSSNLQYNDSKLQSFTNLKHNELSVYKRNKINPFYKDDEKTIQSEKNFNGISTPHNENQQSFVKFISNEESPLVNINSHINNIFDHSSNSININNTFDNSVFTSNIEKTACTSFSTIDEVNSETGDDSNNVEIENILGQQPLNMMRQNNNSSNITEILSTITKDNPDPLLEIPDRFNNIHSNSNSNSHSQPIYHTQLLNQLPYSKPLYPQTHLHSKLTHQPPSGQDEIDLNSFIKHQYNPFQHSSKE